jgi:hypothetical protein
MAKEELPSVEQCMEDIRTKPVVPVWPHIGVLFDAPKNGAYDAIRRGEFEVIRIGKRIKVITAPLRKKLGI